ncbi:VanZ family protein [Amycolatopsis saalfeldensis]|uniref:VanZ like family protein n=1 Tax=Amycolatopsis saalfeldensis TaxID=394193 RepID=A0A1H8YNG4_9PSEU|nr:VanZ family protein [Amycolatopsis saalfeldensis]SEP53541.1 VanZ like family protein [Amycolatopsis saalfeldensis]
MPVFDTNVPVSGWTLIALAAGTAISAVLARSLARRTGWPPRGVLITLLLLSATLALTLKPGNERHANGLHACIPEDPPGLVDNLLFTGGGVAGNVLNFALLLPLTAAAALTCRRTGPAIALALATPTLIELTQSQIPGRYCSLSDWLTNAAGGLAGTLAGYLILRRSNVKHQTGARRTPRR